MTSQSSDGTLASPCFEARLSSNMTIANLFVYLMWPQWPNGVEIFFSNSKNEGKLAGALVNSFCLVFN